MAALAPPTTASAGHYSLPPETLRFFPNEGRDIPAGSVPFHYNPNDATVEFLVPCGPDDPNQRFSTVKRTTHEKAEVLVALVKDALAKLQPFVYPPRATSREEIRASFVAFAGPISPEEVIYFYNSAIDEYRFIIPNRDPNARPQTKHISKSYVEGGKAVVEVVAKETLALESILNKRRLKLWHNRAQLGIDATPRGVLELRGLDAFEGSINVARELAAKVRNSIAVERTEAAAAAPAAPTPTPIEPMVILAPSVPANEEQALADYEEVLSIKAKVDDIRENLLPRFMIISAGFKDSHFSLHTKILEKIEAYRALVNQLS